MFSTTLRRLASNACSKNLKQPLVSSFSTYKTTTGIVGLSVDQNGRETLMQLSSDILNNVKKIPETSMYRINVEKWFNYISKTVANTQDIKTIEDAIDLGQIEEVIEMAKDELTMVDYYFDNKGWELVADEQARADEVVKRMADSIYFTNPREKPAEQPKK